MSEVRTDPTRFLAGGGEMGALVRAHDWASHPLGSAEAWPQTLKTALRLIFNTGHPAYLFWGPPGYCFYNDAYRASIGPERHPGSLGRPAQEVWSEIWDVIGPQIDQVRAGLGATWHENQLVPITRNGRLEDVYWTYSYSPIDDDAAPNGVGGVLVLCSETTEQVLARRELSAERERQQLTLQQMPGFAAVLAGPEHRYTYVNDAYLEIAGDRSFIGRTVSEAFPELEGQGFYELLDEVYATGKAFVARELPIRLERPDGDRVIDMIYQPVRDAAGQVSGIFVGGYDVTEQVRAIARLREGEARLRGVLEGMDEGFVLVDPDFRIVEINAEGLRMEDLGRDEILGRPFWDVWRSVEGSELGAGLRAAMADRTPVRLKNHYAWPDGRAAWFDVRAYPAATGLAIFYRDVTARETVDAELREAEARLWLAIENAEMGFWDVDPVNDQLIWPSRTKAMFGISPGRPVTMADFYEGLHPEDRAAITAAYEAATDPERRATYDVVFRTVGREDGVVRWLAAKGRGSFDAAGRCVRVAGTVIDITERRATEAALADSEARYRALFESIDEGFCVIEFLDGPQGPLSDYVHLEANPAYTINAGIPDIVGKRLREIVSPAEADAWAEIYRQVLERGESIRFERELAETARHLELAAFRIEPPSRRQVVVIFKDITERKRADAALRDLNDTLEARVAERTAELETAHEHLRQSQKLEAMGSLTGGVAHDFNNLLTPIVGVLDLLQRKGVGGEREQRLIAGAAQSAERAKVLVQRLLAFARRQPLQPVPVDLAQLVRNMADLVASTTGPQIRVVVEVADELPPAMADPNQLEMALLNLSVNARDAMPDGGTLRISASRRSGGASGSGPKDYVCLSVADTGAGMDPATLARAVEPFFSTKGVGKGTGLGLSMVHGLASQLGGELRISSRPGLGTNVELWLPRSDTAPAPPTEAPGLSDLTGQGVALIVDDEDIVRLSTAEMLIDLGYRVREAASAEDALEIVRGGTHVDLVVTDHLMPGMTGVDLAREVRARRPDLPVLLVSGYADVDGVASDLPRLTKPFRKDELAASLAALAIVRPET